MAETIRGNDVTKAAASMENRGSIIRSAPTETIIMDMIVMMAVIPTAFNIGIIVIIVGIATKRSSKKRASATMETRTKEEKKVAHSTFFSL